jgi:hypothetical protein
MAPPINSSTPHQQTYPPGIRKIDTNSSEFQNASRLADRFGSTGIPIDFLGTLNQQRCNEQGESWHATIKIAEQLLGDPNWKLHNHGDSDPLGHRDMTSFNDIPKEDNYICLNTFASNNDGGISTFVTNSRNNDIFHVSDGIAVDDGYYYIEMVNGEVFEVDACVTKPWEVADYLFPKP